MTTWVLTTLEKKNVVETEFWTKDGNTIKRSTGFRWGTVYCESDERPDIDLDNPDGLEVFATDYDFELDNLDDGCWVEVEYPEDMTQEEQDRMDELWMKKVTMPGKVKVGQTMTQKLGSMVH